MTAFESDTAVGAVGDGRYAARCEPRSFAGGTPHGGHLAAIVVRALQAQVPRWPLRSITLHFLRPPVQGDLDVAVVVERAGRSLSTATARVEQEGRPCVLAIAALGDDFPSPERATYRAPMPDAPAPETVPAIAPELAPPMARNLELRPCIGPMPFSLSEEEVVTGGWVSFVDAAQRYDAAALAMICDVWFPSPWTRFDGFVLSPTIDLTVHFRAPEVDPVAPLLAIFSSREGRGGYFDESAELWSRDGVLVAQSRQHALLRA